MCVLTFQNVKVHNKILFSKPLILLADEENSKKFQIVMDKMQN